MENVKPGYQLHITSWENDADNYRTVILSALTYEDVKFIIRVVEHFHSQWRTNSETSFKFGNTNIVRYDSEDECKGYLAIKEAYEYCKPSSSQLLADVEAALEDKDDYDFIYEWIGTWMEGEKYRVFDSVEVYYIPEEIENVTEKFEV